VEDYLSVDTTAHLFADGPRKERAEGKAHGDAQHIPKVAE